MQLIKNDFEYRTWMLDAYFYQDKIEGDKLLTDEEMDDFLFEYRPQEYPCLGSVTPSKECSLELDITFFYRGHISEWAKSMGLISTK
ncbi:hypothetical protein J1781_01790 [Rahnella sp. C60]|uniref:Uncharacterized protein n=1 Tax=Rahnella perminowiae TaxID=2816244 RepID=A0ABS6L713_9GAMM|nr:MULTISPECIES: hypothetical protein [Rahnella]UJD90193.1 hypothetical protein FS594_16160 [Rahnella aquatilis]MBU9809771.1 hypothetical protein [Rahnella perminowiae]MBU9813587.1 hypothetical protein [Rahnella perminowiae]MBU9823813.1 hypothetical protein [Rahnella perminowiae]MBU9837498.1 hypothetical protein [Rahnella perminowiae]